MALSCFNCGKGIGYGHAVSHAKNRVRRTFKPNIQKLKVLRDGLPTRVKMCTSCIQKLKKAGFMGNMRPISYLQKDVEIKEAIANMPKMEAVTPVKAKEVKNKKAETIAIEDIVGKK